MHAQIAAHVATNNFLSEYQSGFREGRSTQTALAKVTQDIASATERGHTTALVLLDLSKAFDSICHDTMLQKLHLHYDISANACRLLANYMNGREQRVELNGSTSGPRGVHRGIFQGSKLTPMLFALYINDITECIEHSSYHLYADDLQIYASGDGVEWRQGIQSDLNAILSWCKGIGLTVNG